LLHGERSRQRNRYLINTSLQQGELGAAKPQNRLSGFYDAWKTAKAVPVGVRCLHPVEAGC